MTTFDKREEGFEKKFALDEELLFKANARRNKLLGMWAADKLGLSGAEAEAYAKSVVMADFAEAGDEDVFRKVRDDFNAKSVAQSDQQIRSAMNELMAKHSGKPVEQVERDTDRDRFMSAEDAKVYGLVDNVIQHQAELVAVAK